MCMTDRQIDNRCRKLADIDAQIKALQEQADTIKEELKKELDADGIEERKTANFVVRWKLIVSNRLDSVALKKALPDVYKLYTKKTETRRFTVA